MIEQVGVGAAKIKPWTAENAEECGEIAEKLDEGRL
jgi:hypothetical protein